MKVKELFFGGTGIICILLHSCGGYDRHTSDPPQENSKRFTQEISPILDKYCAGCHNDDNFLINETAFRSSKAYDLVKSGRMPKPVSYESQHIGSKRDVLIKFLESPRDNVSQGSGYD